MWLLLLLPALCLLSFLGSPNFSLFENIEDVSNISSDLDQVVLPVAELASAYNQSICSESLLDSAAEKTGDAKKLFNGLATFQARLLKSYNKDSFSKLVIDVLNADPQIATKSCVPALVIGGTKVSLESGGVAARFRASINDRFA